MRILIVEDDVKISDFLRTALESEYFVVDTADDGAQGLYLAKTNEYDVIVLDSMLPHVSGIEICRELRSADVCTPIIGLSVQSETANKVGFLNGGADDYLTKPFSFAELTARIHAVLRRPRALESDTITIGDITLDPKKHLVRKDDADVYLTRKEFLLLEYLMRNQGVVLSRGMILEHVWDMNADPFSNTIETHVMTLRKKLDSDPHIRLIHTIPGIGYRMGQH